MRLVMKKSMMDKVLFVFNIQSCSDVITNSSSELFVFNSASAKAVKELLDRGVPGWENEYEDPIKFSDMSEDRQEEYLDWILDDLYYDDFKYKTPQKFNDAIIRRYHKLTCLPKEEIPKLFENWNEFELDDNTDIRYYYFRLHLSDYGLKVFKDKYCDDICLWSLDENPDWERQKKITYFCGGQRYHLG